MVLELIVIGVGAWYLVKRSKENKARKAAFEAGQPFYNKDGSVTFPPTYQGCPVHRPAAETQQISANYRDSAPDEVPKYMDEKAANVDQKNGTVVHVEQVDGTRD